MRYDFRKLNEQMEGLKIHELREFAAKVGVRKPSQLNASDAKQGILNVLSGKTPAFHRVSGAGRPRKDSGSERYDEILRNCLIPEVRGADGVAQNSVPYGDDAGEYDGYRTAQGEETVSVTGFLDIEPEGFGVIRARGTGEVLGCLSQTSVRRNRLRSGDEVVGTCIRRSADEYPTMVAPETVNGSETRREQTAPLFEKMEVRYPNCVLADASDVPELPAEAPVAKGARGLVSGTRREALDLFRKICLAAEQRDPAAERMILMCGCLPEEISEIREQFSAEVEASTFDARAERIARHADVVAAHAARMAETGKDVLLLADGLEQMAQAYRRSGYEDRTPEEESFDRIRKWFGTARNLAEGGSVTILVRTEPESEIARTVEGTETLRLSCREGVWTGSADYVGRIVARGEQS